MVPRSEMLLDAKLVLRDGLFEVNPSVSIDPKGYVTNWRDNLLPGLLSPELEKDFRGGKGNELDGKFRAAHSSAALAANAFGPFRTNTSKFPVPGLGSLELVEFEKTMPTGLAGRTPPHLDALAEVDGKPVGIESKCLEYLSRTVAKFSEQYRELENCRATSWFAEMERLRANPTDYDYLDAAQLIKHGFGMTNVIAGRAVLLYIFWEPLDAAYHERFKLHRDEIKRFGANVAGDAIKFKAISYPELWKLWSTAADSTLQAHGQLLARRYGGSLGSYEGYTRVNGRKTDAGFHGEVLIP